MTKMRRIQLAALAVIISAYFIPKEAQAARFGCIVGSCTYDGVCSGWADADAACAAHYGAGCYALSQCGGCPQNNSDTSVECGSAQS
jgi:hypothetical protein